MYRILQKYNGMSEVGVGNKEPIFVIGFPKSGNTWLARLLAEATRSNMKASNEVDAADNSQDRDGDFLIHKEHLVKDVAKVVQGKTVYIVRDVRDVLISGFYHCNRWCNDSLIKRNIFCKWYFDHEVKKLNEMWQGNVGAELINTAKCFVKRVLGQKYEKVRIGNWSDHVTFWSGHPSVVVIRYEDLLQNTEKEMKRILGELEIDVTDKILKETISNQSFKKKKSEFLRSGDSKNIKFLRSGKSGGWRDCLSPVMVENIEKAHADVMNKYGYKLEYYEGEK